MMCWFCIVSYLFLGRKWKGSGIDWNDPCRQSIGGESSKKRGMIMRQKMPYDRMFPNRGPARGQCPQGPWRGNEPVCPRPGHSYYPPGRVGNSFQDNQGRQQRAWHTGAWQQPMPRREEWQEETGPSDPMAPQEPTVPEEPEYPVLPEEPEAPQEPVVPECPESPE